MTERARISQADMTRAVMAVKAAGFERARIVMDLEKRIIEIIVGESNGDGIKEPNPLDRLLLGKNGRNPWDDE